MTDLYEHQNEESTRRLGQQCILMQIIRMSSRNAFIVDGSKGIDELIIVDDGFEMLLKTNQLPRGEKLGPDARDR